MKTEDKLRALAVEAAKQGDIGKAMFFLGSSAKDDISLKEEIDLWNRYKAACDEA